MQISVQPLHVGVLPRVPFLAHSEELLRLLLATAPAAGSRILEIGCGPNSPLVPMLRRSISAAEIHQIDARPDVVAVAARQNPDCRVEQMLAANMAPIASASKHLVVAMSVFDQNAADLCPGIASEVLRILAPGGLLVYIHNEELNLPSTAASLLQRSAGQTLLLPSDSWQPGNELEYCTGRRGEIESALATLGSEGEPIARFLNDVYPQFYGRLLARTADLRVSAPGMRERTLQVMTQIRACVARLRREWHIDLKDHRTSDLLRNHVEGGIFSEDNGFETLLAGMFEIRRGVAWQTYFSQRPPARYFVRGTMHLGYTAESAPPTVAEFRQELNPRPVLDDSQALFIAYQYGLAVRPIRRSA